MKQFIIQYRGIITKAVFALTLMPLFASAGRLSAPDPIKSVDDLKDKVFCDGADVLYTFAIVISVIFVLYAAFLYVTSGGDEKKITKARDTITYAAIGVAVAVLAAGVPYVVTDLLGASLGSSPCRN